MSAVRLSPLVRVVLAPNPSPYTLEGTNTYLIGERDPIVLDPGPNDDGHLERVLEEAGTPSVVLLSHRHPDHAEGAERFADMARAPLAAYASQGSSVCATAAPIADRQRISADGATLSALYTPGHASDHLSFVLEEEQSMFTGDHVLGRGTTVIAYPDGDMAAYLVSLDRARAAKPRRLYPGHGPVVEDPDPVLAYYKEHRLEREREVLAGLDAGDETVAELVARIYAEYDVVLHGPAAMSVLAHLQKLRNEGVVKEEGDVWRRA
jgi:glyoxylase-like metal-dependent hydrolase (beta-lactamase superfamily II)